MSHSKLSVNKVPLEPPLQEMVRQILTTFFVSQGRFGADRGNIAEDDVNAERLHKFIPYGTAITQCLCSVGPTPIYTDNTGHSMKASAMYTKTTRDVRLGHPPT